MIDSAMTAGGTLTVKQMMPGMTYLQATMSWPDENPISGEINLSTVTALESLDKALADDFAKQQGEAK